MRKKKARGRWHVARRKNSEKNDRWLVERRKMNECTNKYRRCLYDTVSVVHQREVCRFIVREKIQRYWYAPKVDTVKSRDHVLMNVSCRISLILQKSNSVRPKIEFYRCFIINRTMWSLIIIPFEPVCYGWFYIVNR